MLFSAVIHALEGVMKKSLLILSVGLLVSGCTHTTAALTGQSVAEVRAGTEGMNPLQAGLWNTLGVMVAANTTSTVVSTPHGTSRVRTTTSPSGRVTSVSVD